MSIYVFIFGRYAVAVSLDVGGFFFYYLEFVRVYLYADSVALIPQFLLRMMATKAVFNVLGFKMGMGAVIFGLTYEYLPFMTKDIARLSKVPR